MRCPPALCDIFGGRFIKLFTTLTWRYFRFRLRTLLMLPILVALAWWWATWPERTARRFVDFLNAGDVESAKAMIDGPQPSAGFWKIAESRKFTFDKPVFQPATQRDYFSGTKTFEFDWRRTSSSDRLGPFLAQRNCVTLSPPASGAQVRLFFVFQSDAADTLVQYFEALYQEGIPYSFKVDKPKGRLVCQVPQNAFGEITALTLLFESEEQR